jgi:glycosyltransferase involved in cell wall biosynthesis
MDDFLNPSPAGAEISVRNLCDEYLKVGCEVHIVTASRRHRSTEYTMHRGCPTIGIPARPVSSLFHDFQLIYRVGTPYTVAAAVASTQPDIIQVHNLQNYSSLHTLSALRHHFPRTPIVLTLHDYTLFCKGALRCKDPTQAAESISLTLPSKWTCFTCQKNTFNPLKSPIARSILNRVPDHIVYVSKFLQRFYCDNGVTTESSVIYNGASESDCAQGSITGARTHLDHLSVICGGRMVPRKGFDTLVQATALLPESVRSRLKITLFGGDTPYAAELKRRITSNHLSAVVALQGWLSKDEVSVLTSNADVAVLPSLYPDPLPRLIFEYGARGTPIIASAVGGVPEIIHHGVTGHLFPAGDHVELSRLLNQAVLNIGAFRELARTLKQRIESDYRADQSAQMRLQLYTTLLARAQRFPGRVAESDVTAEE